MQMQRKLCDSLRKTADILKTGSQQYRIVRFVAQDIRQKDKDNIAAIPLRLRSM